MDKETVRALMVMDLETIQYWVSEHLEYVKAGTKDHNAQEDFIFYYRYIRTVATTI